MNKKENIQKSSFTIKLITIELLLACMFIGVSFFTNLYIKKENARQITRIVSRMVKKGDHRSVIYTLGSAKMENFNGVGYFDSKERRIFTIPADLEEIEISNTNWYENIILENIYYGEFRQSGLLGTLKFTFYSFDAILFGFMLWLLALVMTLPFLKKYYNLAIKKMSIESERRRTNDLVELASLVKHDLRSPLQSILTAVQTSSEIDQNSKEKILSGISRIQNVSLDLNSIKKRQDKANIKKNTSEKKVCSIFLSTQEIINEKVNTYCHIRNLKIGHRFLDDTISNFVNFDESDYKRIISNLINNSIESFDVNQEKKEVEVCIQRKGTSIEISVIDNGPGIPFKIKKLIGKKGITSGKENGTGLSLYSARKKILEVGGEFHIESNHKGTTIRFTLNKTDTPKCYAETYKFNESSSYVILDDDHTIIDRFKEDKGVLSGATKNIESFSSIIDFKNWIKEEKYTGKSDKTFFIDYDLKDPDEDGLDIIKLIDQKFNIFLFTNNYDDFFLKRNCIKEGVRIIPKSVIGWG